jgi:hypothetical protein
VPTPEDLTPTPVTPAVRSVLQRAIARLREAVAA